jgi:hypothetical protein
MSILDILVDNGLSTEHDILAPEGETEFNADIDALATRIKNIASSINDAGAAFMSRIDAKEVMEGFRNRLELAVRRKPKPRQGIFDKADDESEDIRKQSELMRKHFKKIEAPTG